MRGLLAIIFLILPALSYGYNGDPNMTPGFSDQGGGRVDIGAHAQTSGAVDMLSEVMSALAGTGYSNSTTSGVKYEKQASRSLTRMNAKGQVIRDGETDETQDGKDIVK